VGATEVAAGRIWIAAARKSIRASAMEIWLVAKSIRACQISVAQARIRFALSRTSIRTPATAVAPCGIPVGVARISVGLGWIQFSHARIAVATGDTGFRARATSVAEGRKPFWLDRSWFWLGRTLGGAGRRAYPTAILPL
jgi:hypothetical protein